MPAQSPTLSPTLSAITAGLRGSSSGIPASTLPTRSAPTSAALVKMPPPSRAKTEISEPPKPEPDQRIDGGLRAVVEERRQRAVVPRHADQREPDDQQPCDGAAAEGDLERRRDAAAGRFGDAAVGAHRDVHADVAGGAREDAADREADGHGDVLDEDQRHEENDAHRRRSSCTAGSGRRAHPDWTAAEMLCIRSLPGESASSARAVSAP